jgi:stage II sporulation protein AB (anti-sigma F factor)
LNKKEVKILKPTNEMQLNFVSRSSNESFARGAVAAFVAQLDPTIAELADIKTAVSEAVTNCIVHAYKDGIGTVYITSKIFENGKVIIKIRDKGCGIPDINQAMEPLFTTGGDDRSGLGFAVMQSFMDKVKVFSKSERGTTVTLEKFIIKRTQNRGG